jgi:Uncharacterized conserved protein
MPHQLGLVVNPVAGIGGPAGLKGSDGRDVQDAALRRGAVARAGDRATAALAVVAAGRPDAVIITADGAMGADAVRRAGLQARIVAAPADPASTSADDTTTAVRALIAAGADLVLFAGGDGTARDVCAAMPTERTGDGGAPVTGDDGPIAAMGVPAGVKMYSACFAVSPAAAGGVAASWLADQAMPLREGEVLDVAEEQLRHGRVEPRLFGYLQVPDDPGRTQARKAATPQSQAAAARSAAHGVVSSLEPGVHYLLGPGSTVGEVARQLGVSKTPLGVDVLLDGRIVRSDVSESDLLALLPGTRARAVVTIIGGQGFLLGRGNQQLSAPVIRQLEEDPLIVVSTEQKLIDLAGRPLLVDTGDPEVDARLAGYIRIITGASTTSIYPVSSATSQPTASRNPNEGTPSCA